MKKKCNDKLSDVTWLTSVTNGQMDIIAVAQRALPCYRAMKKSLTAR